MHIPAHSAYLGDAAAHHTRTVHKLITCAAERKPFFVQSIGRAQLRTQALAHAFNRPGIFLRIEQIAKQALPAGFLLHA